MNGGVELLIKRGGYPLVVKGGDENPWAKWKLMEVFHVGKIRKINGLVAKFDDTGVYSMTCWFGNFMTLIYFNDVFLHDSLIVVFDVDGTITHYANVLVILI